MCSVTGKIEAKRPLGAIYLGFQAGGARLAISFWHMPLVPDAAGCRRAIRIQAKNGIFDYGNNIFSCRCAGLIGGLESEPALGIGHAAGHRAATYRGKGHRRFRNRFAIQENLPLHGNQRNLLPTTCQPGQKYRPNSAQRNPPRFGGTLEIHLNRLALIFSS